MDRIRPSRTKLYEETFYHAAIGKALVGPGGLFWEVNDALCELLGYEREELIGTNFRAVTHPADVRADEELIARMERRELQSYRFEKRFVHRDGSTIWADLSVAAIFEEGRISLFIVQIQDVTERTLARRELTRQVEFRKALVDLHIQAGVTEAEEFHRYLMEVAASVISGAQSGSLLLRDGESDRYRFAAAVGFDLAALQRTYILESELYRDASPRAGLIRGIDNSHLPEERRRVLAEAGATATIAVSLAVPILIDGRPLGLLSLDSFDDPDAFDESAIEMATLLGQQLAALWQRLELEADLRRQKEAFEHQALHDGLTGLPNRLLFDDRLGQAIEQAHRTGRSVALLFIDLDHFKRINDDYGHRAGDALLCGIAERLRSSLRSSDTAARWGGDEFVVLLTNLMQPPDLESATARMLDVLTRPLDLGGATITPSVSVGAALYPQAAGSAEELVRQADGALYEVKRAGRGALSVRTSA